ncbi:MAG: HlyC/CorC family transporter, partial [Chitinophagaceae bacterium]|nr:HlyC/CorC family transporter [Chitinophagaceae bacterium]
PENFLSSVQVGITLIGIVAGAYGGATLTDNLETYVKQISFLVQYSHTFSLLIVIGGITYFSIVIGELVPKSIAMNNPEPIALFCVPIIKYFTLATFPFVKLLSFSTSLIIKMFGIKENDAERISEEELLFMLKNAGNQGVLEKEESQVHQNLFYFTDQTANSLLTHRSELEWINIQDNNEEIFDKIKETAHSKFIVGDGSLDKVLGILNVKDFLGNYKKENFKLEDIIQSPIYVVQNTPAFKILNIFRAKKQYVAIVIDEFGGTKGMVTLHDLTEAIMGDLPDEDEGDEASIIQREDGSFLIDGRTLIYEINQYFQKEIIEENVSDYTTISGFLLSKLQAMPHTGDIVHHENCVFEIIDLDAARIDKIELKFVEISEEE